MSELSSQLLPKLVLAARRAHSPTESDRARIFSNLEARLELVGGVTVGGARWMVGTDMVASLNAKGFAVTAAVVMAIGVAALTYLSTRDPMPRVASPMGLVPNAAVPIPPTSDSATAAPVIAESGVGNSPGQETIVAVQDPPKSVLAATASLAASRRHDTLSEEVAILSRAQAALHGGRAAIALQLLAEHQRRFRRGLLAEEREVARIQALCALGRVSEARALMGGLAPQSVGEASARQACATFETVTSSP